MRKTEPVLLDKPRLVRKRGKRGFLGWREIRITLATPLVYISPRFGRIVVPAGFPSDGYSMPWIARRLYSNYSSDDFKVIPALIHDKDCVDGVKGVSPRSHVEASELFEEALLFVGVPSWRARWFRRAVAWFGPKFNKAHA